MKCITPSRWACEVTATHTQHCAQHSAGFSGIRRSRAWDTNETDLINLIHETQTPDPDTQKLNH